MNFDTSVNTEGVEEGAQDIQKQFERVIKAIEGLGNKLAKSFEGLNVQNVTQELKKVDTATKSTEKRVHKTKKALDSLDDIDGPAAIKAQILEDTAALEKLNAQKTEWDDLGVPTDSGGYKDLISQITELETSIKYAKSELQDLEAEQKASTSTAEAQANAENTASKANEKLDQTAKSAGSSTGKLAKKAAVNKIQLAGLGQKINAIAGNFNKLRLTAGKALSAIGKHLKSNTASAGGFGKKLKQSISMYSRVFKMMLLFQLFSSGMDLVKTQVGGALKMNAQFCASLAAIKGNLEIALQPVYNAILPALNALMAGLRQASIWLASFTHTLFGGTAQSSAAAAKALDSQADSTNSLAKANKKAAKSQSELDEFNIISSKDSDSGSSGGIKPSYDDAGLINGQNAFAEKLKEAWKNSDFTEIGQIVADKINEALNNIDWSQIQATSQKIALCLATFLNGFVGELDWSLVGSTIANGLNTGLIFAYTFLTTFNFLQFGQAIGTMLNSGISTFDWILLGNTIAAGLNAAFDGVYGFVTTFDWAQLGTSIGLAITTFFQNTNWAELGMDISGFAVGLLTLLLTTIQNTDWSSIGTSIGTVIANIDWITIFQTVWNVIVSAFIGLQDIFTSFLTTIGMNPIAAEMITNFALAIGAITVAFELLAPVITAVSGAISFLAANPIVLVIAAIVALGVGIYELIKHWDDVVATMTGVGNYLGGVFTNCWNAIVATMKSVSDFIVNVFSNDWTNQFGIIGNVINAWLKNVSDVFIDVKQIFGGVIEFVKGVFSGNWSQAWNGIIQIFKGIWGAIVDIAKSPINMVIGLINGMLSAIETGLNWVVSKVNKLSFDVPDWVPGIGGKEFGFNLPNVSIGKIPYLATGAVIPANAPFTAVLGDQRHGTNLEAPEGLIRKIMQEELAKANTGSGGNVQVNVTVQQNDEGVWKVVKTEYKKEKDMTGVDPILGF